MSDITTTDIHFYFYDCQCPDELLFNGELVNQAIEQAISRAGLVSVGKHHKNFENGGLTASILLLESHVIIHTWPERNRTVVGDISICNFSANNVHKTLQLYHLIRDIFCPRKTLQHQISSPAVSPIYDQAENLSGFPNSFPATRLLADNNNRENHLQIFENERHGKILSLNNQFLTAEKAHCSYYEPLAHVPMLTHDNPKNVLIIGGHDPRIVAEVMKYPTVKKCDIIESNSEIMRFTRQIFSIAPYSLPRVHLHLQAISSYLNQTSMRYDVIIANHIPSYRQSASFFSDDFHKLLINCLAVSGLACFNFGLVRQSHNFSNLQKLHHHYRMLKPFINYIPLFNGEILFALGGHVIELPETKILKQKIREYNLESLHYFNTEIFKSLFALPNNFRKAI